MASAPASSSPLIVVGSHLTSNNHGAAITITAGVSLGATIIALTLRFFQRWPWTQRFRSEDALLVAATTCEIAAIAALARAIHTGLGRHVSSLLSDDIAQTRSALVAAFALTYLTEGLAATSFILLLQAVKPAKLFKNIMWGLIGVVIAWTLAAIVRCAASSSTAVASLDRTTWIVVGAIFAAVQLILLGASMWMIWPLRMALTRKVTCSLYFGLSFPVAAIVVVRLVYTPNNTLQSDYTWNDLNMVIIFLVESNLSIIAAAYPAMRGFLTQISTGLLVPETKGSQAGSHAGSKEGGYALQTIGGSGGRRGDSQTQSPHTFELPQTHVPGWKKSYHTADVRGDARSDHSYGSEVIMVRHSVEIENGDM